MTPIEFLRTVWPEKGLFCIAVPLPSKGYAHHVFETIEGAAAFVETHLDTKNIFFATHTLKEPRVWDPRHHRDRGKKDAPFVGGWRVRVQENSRSSRVFFFDLDVDAENAKKYESQEAAVAGLKAFVKATRLPIPMVVSSGGGLHIYWIVADEIPSEAWVTTAARLKQLAHFHGLKIDDARTTDTASVLRVAGTFNYKKEERRPVQVFRSTSTVNNQAFLDLVQAAIADSGVMPAAPKKPALSGLAAKLGDNTTPVFDEASAPTMTSLLRSCAQIRRIAMDLGAHSHEPEWYAVAGALKFIKNGRKHYQKISSGHPDYDPIATDAKFDQWEKGFVSCEKMKDVCGSENAHLCEACPFYRKAKFPVVAARFVDDGPPAEKPTVTMTVAGVEVVVKIPTAPYPWRRSRSSGIGVACESTEKRTYISLSIYPYDFYPLERSDNEGHETETQLWRAHLPHGVTHDIAVPASVFVDDRSLRQRLADRGIYPPEFLEFKDYMSAYIRELQRLNPTSPQHNHLGWTSDHSKFVLATKVLHTDGSETPAQLAKVAANSKAFVSQAGSLQKQAELMSFYQNRAYAAQQMFVLAGLASPLLFATGHDGVVIHAYGESGGSKSSALLTAASFWGNPKSYVLNCTDSGATDLYRSTRLGILNNLPCCLDEITGMRVEVAKNFAIGASQRGPRGRLDRDGSPKESLTGNERSSIIMSTANVSLQSLLSINNAAGVAAAARVFEIRFEKDLGIHQPIEADAYLRQLFDNYGWIGENYMRLVVAKLDKVRSAIVQTLDSLADAGSMRSYERFWFSGAASALVAGDIAGKLKYVIYDLPYLRDWFLKEQLPEMRGTIVSQSDASAPLTILMDYLAHINGNTLRTKKFPGDLRPNIDGDTVRGQLVAHHHIDEGVIHILKQDFRSYCERTNRYSQEVLRALLSKGIITSVDKRITLGEGTPLAKGRAWCFTVNLLHPEVASIVPNTAPTDKGNANAS